MGKEEIHYGASMLCRGETKLHRHLHTNMKQSPKYTVRLGHTQTHTTLWEAEPPGGLWAWLLRPCSGPTACLETCKYQGIESGW